MQTSRLKLAISLAIIAVGLIVTVLAVSSSPATTNSGIIIDFGDRDTVYTELDSESIPDPFSALEFACDANGYELVVDDGAPVSIDGFNNDPNLMWSLYVVKTGTLNWERIDSGYSDIRIDDYAATCWGYCPVNGHPTRAVDETGVCFYGYERPERVVSLAPSCTESICAAGGMDLIVATDQYSNYPEEIEQGREDGSIPSIGGFTNPSYEMVLKMKPDLVVCIGSQSSHVATADKLRANHINVIVTSGGEAIDTVMDNTFMVGVGIHEEDHARGSIDVAMNQIGEVEDVLDGNVMIWDKKLMVSLSAVKSPWVSGSDTFVSDVMTHIHTTNVYKDESGWVQINSETIIKNNPEYIIVVASDYDATQADYDRMIAGLSTEWRGTDAYKNGQIYLYTGDACDVLSRPGPRVAQITELLARTVQGDSFDDGIEMPKFIGDDYRDYLTISKEGCI